MTFLFFNKVLNFLRRFIGFALELEHDLEQNLGNFLCSISIVVISFSNEDPQCSQIK